MYDVILEAKEDKNDYFIYKSKNINGQIIVCECFMYQPGVFNFSFYITTKRRNGFQENKITGTDGLRSLYWAKRCLENIIWFLNDQYKCVSLMIFPTDNKRRVVYKRILLNMGFIEEKNRWKGFKLKIN